MSPDLALTIIAVCLMILVVMALAVVVALLMLVRRLIGLEHTVVHQVTNLREEIQSIVHHIRDTSDRVSHTVQDVRKTTRAVSKAARRIAGWLGNSSGQRTLLAKARPWWVSGLSMGWSLYQRRRKKSSLSDARPPAPPA